MQRTYQINQWFKTISTIFLFLLAGCSGQSAQMVVVNDNNFQSGTNTTPIERNSIENTDKDIKCGNLCRIKYHPSYSQNHPVFVEGKLGTDKKYPVILDTGASVALFVNDIHINENKLITHPFKTTTNASGWGTCDLPELHIGEITLQNWPCFYQRQHAELRFFGLPLAKDKSVIIGLPTLQEFKYVAFDSVRKEVEFSYEKVFEAEQPEQWAKYPFTIEEYLGGNTFLFVKIPIAGEELELQLDTGSGKGLAIRQESWQRLQQKIQNTKLNQGRELYPYIGWLDCEQTVIPKLNVGNRTINKAKVSVFPDDSPLVDNCQGLLGMQFFRDTVIVLDFERNLMWVNNSQGR